MTTAGVSPWTAPARPTSRAVPTRRTSRPASAPATIPASTATVTPSSSSWTRPAPACATPPSSAAATVTGATASPWTAPARPTSRAVPGRRTSRPASAPATTPASTAARRLRRQAGRGRRRPALRHLPRRQRSGMGLRHRRGRRRPGLRHGRYPFARLPGQPRPRLRHQPTTAVARRLRRQAGHAPLGKLGAGRPAAPGAAGRRGRHHRLRQHDAARALGSPGHGRGAFRHRRSAGQPRSARPCRTAAAPTR